MTPEVRMRAARAHGLEASPLVGERVTATLLHAVTVKLTPEIIASVHGHATDEEALAAAFREAGFIVET